MCRVKRRIVLLACDTRLCLLKEMELGLYLTFLICSSPSCILMVLGIGQSDSSARQCLHSQAVSQSASHHHFISDDTSGNSSRSVVLTQLLGFVIALRHIPPLCVTGRLVRDDTMAATHLYTFNLYISVSRRYFVKHKY